MKVVFNLIFCFFIGSVLSQSAIEFDHTEYDFGSVATRSYQPHKFIFTNNGDQPVAILMANKSNPKIKVGYKRGFIQPGENGYVEVFPDINELITFKEEISVLTSVSAKPIILTVSGSIISTQDCINPLNPTPSDEVEDDDEEDYEISVEYAELPVTEYAPNNIIFLVDVSLSMQQFEKLEKLKTAVNDLFDILRPIDQVTLISYSDRPKVKLECIDGGDKFRFKREVRKLEPKGSTNGVSGLEKAYELAQKYYINDGNNQVILATDGMFTGTRQDPREFKGMLEEKAENGIILSIVGLGIDDDGIENMKVMAGAGHGDYLHVDQDQIMHTLLIEEIKNKSRIR